MEIREMNISDYNEVYSLWTNCTGMGLNSIDDSKLGIERLLIRNPKTCLVALENDKIVGTILAGNDGRRGYIYHTAVSPDFRRRGIGSALAEKVISTLKNLGITKVVLVAFSRNKDGNAFWEKLGFSERTDLTYRNKTLIESKRFDT